MSEKSVPQVGIKVTPGVGKHLFTFSVSQQIVGLRIPISNMADLSDLYHQSFFPFAEADFQISLSLSLFVSFPPENRTLVRKTQ